MDRFLVTSVKWVGRFVELTLVEDGCGASQRMIRVKRQNMPKGDEISDGVYTSFRGRVPIHDGFEGRAFISGGNFLEKDSGDFAGTIEVSVAPRPMASL